MEKAAAAAIETLVKSWYANAIERVDPLCDQILDAPYDVISLNEVWDEESRARFIERLSEKGPYKYHTEVLGGSAIATSLDVLAASLLPIMGPIPLFLLEKLTGLLKTSGLLLFSRHPFVEISKGSFCKFVRYADGALPDSMASKGGAAVVICPPGFRNVVIGFTHLQADYADKIYPDVRKKQIKQWWELMSKVGKRTVGSHYIALGDLNIIGNAAKATGEYKDIFQSSHPFSVNLHDQWLTTHSPDDVFLTHPGDTQRLDYVLAGTWRDDMPLSSIPKSETICAHHMMLAKNLWSGPPQVRTPFSEPDLLARGGGAKLSDHIGINAVINFDTPFCNPKSALDVAFSGDKTSVNCLLPGDGAYLWFRILRKGTIFLNVHLGFDIEVMAFDPTDLSSGRLLVEPPDWTDTDQRELGSRFSLPNSPAFVRVRQRHPTAKSIAGALTVTMAGGQSKKMAQYLEGSRDCVLKFPDEVLNADDTMWCEALPNTPTQPNTPQTIRLVLSWNAKGKIAANPFELRLEDSSGNILGKTLCGDPKGNSLSVSLARPGRIFPRVRRLAKSAPESTLRWDSDLTLLHGPTFADRAVPNAGPLELECTDETDSDWAGSYEPILRVTIDNMMKREQSYEDVDSGSIRSIEKIAPIVYRKGLLMHLEEGKESTDQGVGTLGSNAPNELSKTLYLDVGDGNYKLRGNFSHWLESSPAAKKSS